MRITTEQAADLLGMTPNAVRQGMKEGWLDIGHADGSKYYIWSEKVEAYLTAAPSREPVVMLGIPRSKLQVVLAVIGG